MRRWMWITGASAMAGLVVLLAFVPVLPGGPIGAATVAEQVASPHWAAWTFYPREDRSERFEVAFPVETTEGDVVRFTYRIGTEQIARGGQGEILFVVRTYLDGAWAEEKEGVCQLNSGMVFGTQSARPTCWVAAPPGMHEVRLEVTVASTVTEVGTGRTRAFVEFLGAEQVSPRLSEEPAAVLVDTATLQRAPHPGLVAVAALVGGTVAAALGGAPAIKRSWDGPRGKP